MSTQLNNICTGDIEQWHTDKVEALAEAGSLTVVCDGPLRCSVTGKVAISDVSWLDVVVSLDAGSASLDFDCEAEWHEEHKLLKVEFPTDVRPAGATATYEVQWGHVQRPTHGNTTWDSSKFEVTPRCCWRLG